MGNHNRILHIWISLGSKFQLQQTILIFRSKLAQKKNLFCQKQQKMNIAIESFILELV